MFNYKDIWNPVWSVVHETLNCAEREVKNPHGSLLSRFMEPWHYNWPCNMCHLMHLHVIL